MSDMLSVNSVSCRLSNISLKSELHHPYLASNVQECDLVPIRQSISYPAHVRFSIIMRLERSLSTFTQYLQLLSHPVIQLVLVNELVLAALLGAVLQVYSGSANKRAQQTRVSGSRRLCRKTASLRGSCRLS
jgi:hypothetical protein